MIHEVRLPDIGEGVAEGEIVRWMVGVGDAIRDDQPMVEVMTDKATVEIPSPRTGRIAEIRVAAGKVVPVGTVIVTIEVGAPGAAPGGSSGGGTGSAPAVPTPASSAPAAATPAPAASGRAPAYGSMPPDLGAAPTGPVHATPAVRALAREKGVRLETVRGSGPQGRILKQDLAGAITGAAASPATGSASPSSGSEDILQRIPLRGLRRRIAEHMRHSLDTAAHFTFVAECDMTEIVRHREGLRARAAERQVNLTYLAYVLKALVQPLRDFPLLNASLDDWSHEIVVKRALNLGVAAATREGLTVPVIRDVDRMPLLAIAAELQRLANAARTNTLKLDELQGGTFTVTSTGARGGVLATPIIHHPQVAILGVHEVKKRPAVVNDQIVARDLTNLSLSLDHRVVDGAVGADFLYALIARLEQPAAWLGASEIG